MDNAPLSQFWQFSKDEALKTLKSSEQGLGEEEASKRLKEYGPNLLKPKKRFSSTLLFFKQFFSPLILILIGAAILAFSFYDKTDAAIILVIVFISGILGFWQEKGAMNALAKLIVIVQIKTTVLREGKQEDLWTESVVPGDILVLNAGDIIPADALLIESKDLFVDESNLTGESFTVEKHAKPVAADSPLSKRQNSLFMGTHVISGTGKALVIFTGPRTEFGKIAEKLRNQKPKTQFDIEIRRFGAFLMELTFVMVTLLFACSILFHRPLMESFLFALALAVGLIPQLLPAIVTVNLARGAKKLAKRDVIIKRLVSIENFGNMNILCVDKTGTITEGTAHIDAFLNVKGEANEKVFQYAFLNAYFQTGYTNPIDQAILDYDRFNPISYSKLDEVPYDFLRKRLSILVKGGSLKQPLIICKGSLNSIFSVCSHLEDPSGQVVEIASYKNALEKKYEELSLKGFRVVGVAYRECPGKERITFEDETSMVFLGFLVLNDPIKKGIKEMVSKLNKLGVSLRLLTGDNALVSKYVAKEVGFSSCEVLTGKEIFQLNDLQLGKKLDEVFVFAELEPFHKERIVNLLKKKKVNVGFLGDGINDALAMHASDVGISVNTAADMLKEEADIILLKKDLSVLINGVKEGRKIFANTLKYIFMATSANFGNMFSMAGSSLFLPFLPLLPKQVLLTNLLTDFPEMTISTDDVDKEMVEKPLRLNMRFIMKFMFVFGCISSIFDYATFGVLFWMKSSQEQFRTGWFLESVASAAIIVLVIRTQKRFYQSKPSKYLLWATLLTIAVTFSLPFIPFIGPLLGFTILPWSFYGVIFIIICLYILSVEAAKKWFYRHVSFSA